MTFTFDLQGEIRKQSLYFVAIGCGMIVVAYAQMAFWIVAAERQTKMIRRTLFRSILRKEINFFDSHSTGGLNIRLTDDVNKIRDGMSDKLGTVIQNISGLIAGFVLGFAKGWKLTLVILSISPALVIAAMLLTKVSVSNRCCPPPMCLLADDRPHVDRIEIVWESGSSGRRGAQRHSSGRVVQWAGTREETVDDRSLSTLYLTIFYVVTNNI